MCPVEGEAFGKGEVESASAGEEPILGQSEHDAADTGARIPIKVADPRLPNADEIEQHNLTHLPYRSWCPHCVRGKGKTMDHRKVDRERTVREIHVDYCFMGTKSDTSAKSILVAKEYESKSVMASVVPVKGSSQEFPARRIVAFIRELGLEGQDIVLRSDQEPAIQDLLREVGKKRLPAKTFFENSPVGSSASNGIVERGVQTVQGQIRVLRDALGMRLQTEIMSSHNILSWLVEFAGVLINRYEVGRDGKTPHERLRGKQSRLLGLEFGEKLNFRRSPIGTKMAKLDTLWSDGVFLGYRTASGEIVVGTADGVYKTRTVKRKAQEHRWDKQNLDMVGGVPWRTSPGEQEEADGVMPAVDIGMELPEVPIERPPVEEKKIIPRRLYIKVGDIQRFGATVNCNGCVATLRGQRGIPHTDSCRKRLTEEIGKHDAERVKKARDREMEFYESALRESDESRKRARRDESTLPSGSSSSVLPRDDSGMEVVQDDSQRGSKRRADDEPVTENEETQTKGELQALAQRGRRIQSPMTESEGIRTKGEA